MYQAITRRGRGLWPHTTPIVKLSLRSADQSIRATLTELPNSTSATVAGLGQKTGYGRRTSVSLGHQSCAVKVTYRLISQISVFFTRSRLRATHRALIDIGILLAVGARDGVSVDWHNRTHQSLVAA
jgi:hypothetical protein